jgi:integrator complex subunit 11
VDDEIEIKAYYAGHVLGAALFHIKVTNIYGASETCVYTGDYNMTPDRHLGSAWIDECEPDLLISESTYAVTIRDSKRARERHFLRKVHDAVQKGGKVLVPVFALGRAQELLILIESYWSRMSDLKDVPIYFSAGLTERANDYYKMFISWTNEKIKKTFVDHNMFDFKMIESWKPEYAEKSGPMVLFASPGMVY